MKPTSILASRTVAYTGYRVEDAVRVVRLRADGLSRELEARYSLRLHNPDFSWGRSQSARSGAAQLALAILADHLGRSGVEAALDLYHDFAADAIRSLGRDAWILTTAQVAEWIEDWRNYQLAEGDSDDCECRFLDLSEDAVLAATEGGAA